VGFSKKEKSRGISPTMLQVIGISHWNLFSQNLLSDRRQRARDIDLSMGERDVFCPVFRRKEEGYGNWGVRGGS
jgi:hypothetical protein